MVIIMKNNVRIFLISELIVFTLAILLIGSCNKEKSFSSSVPNLEVEKFYPNSGRGGTLVAIEGSGFSANINDYEVHFSDVKGEVISATDSKLVVRSPQKGSTGILSLNIAGEIFEVGNYTYQALSVQSLKPDRAQGGAQIEIQGEGFSSVYRPPSVFFNGVEAKIINAVDTLLVVEVPEKGKGVGPVKVEVDAMESIGPDFSYMSVESMKPLTGGEGTNVTILGEGFEETLSKNKVSFGGLEATVKEASANRLVVQAPEKVESGQVVISIGDEVIYAPDFTVVDFPIIDKVSPLSGPEGVEMVIEGKYFSAEKDETHVYINDVKIDPSEVSANQIRLVLPGGTGSGKIRVEVNDQSTEGPEFKDQQLGIVSMTPEDGLKGTEVEIKGAGFSAVVSENTVTFNGMVAQIISATENSLTVVAPNDLESGALQVEVGGLLAEGPTEFIRAGVESLGHGQLNLSTEDGSITVDNQGNVYVLEIDNHRVMKITPQGSVSLFAGSNSGSSGNQDGVGTNVRLQLTNTAGLAYDKNENIIYLTDPGNRALKSISMDGEVNTIISDLGSIPGKIALRPDGKEMFISNVGSTTRNWRVLLPAATFTDMFMQHGNPHVRHAYTQDSNLYSQQIATFTGAIGINRPNGSGGWTSGGFGWAGASARGYVDAVGGDARFGVITGIAIDGVDHLMILDPDNLALRRVDVHTVEVTTAYRGEQGYADGDFRQAKWSSTLMDLVVGPDGHVYVLDCGNNAVRKVMLR